MAGRAMVFSVLLVAAIAVGGLSLWTFEAEWIGFAVFLVGLCIALLGSRRPLEMTRLLTLLGIELSMLLATAVVGFAIDCGLHCS